MTALDEWMRARRASLGARWREGTARRTFGRCPRATGAGFVEPHGTDQPAAMSVRMASTVSTSRSASPAEKTSGGLIFITL